MDIQETIVLAFHILQSRAWFVYYIILKQYSFNINYSHLNQFLNMVINNL